MKPERYPNFDLLRLLLALEVAIVHTWILTGHPGGVGRWPFNPVPAFIGISGALVLGSFENSGSWKRFAWKRFLRVAPAFSASLALVALLFGWSEVAPTLRHWATLGLSGTGNNEPLWSLAVEEILYTVMALLFLAGAYRAKWPIWILFAISAVAAPLLVPHVHAGRQPIEVERIGWLLPSFLAGSLIHIYRDRLKRLPKWIWTLLVVACLGLRNLDPNANQWHFLAILTAISSVGFGMFGPTIKLETRRIGDLSMGLYSYHWPLVLAFGWWGLAAVIPLAVLSWFGMESKALKLKDWDFGGETRGCARVS